MVNMDAASNQTLIPEKNSCERVRSEGITAQVNENERTERLMILKIVNENFKSYAGIQELGPFHKVMNDQYSVVHFKILNVNFS